MVSSPFPVPCVSLPPPLPPLPLDAAIATDTAAVSALITAVESEVTETAPWAVSEPSFA